MMQQALLPTFGDHRRTRFANIPPTARSLYEYLEQLAITTGTNVDHLDMSLFLSVSMEHPFDRRAVNKIFFGLKPAEPRVVPPATEEALKNASIQLGHLTAQRITAIKANQKTHLTNAHQAYVRYETALALAWGNAKEIYALTGRPANYITDEIRKVLLDGFWVFQKYENQKLYLETASDIVLRETNAAAGIHRVVNMGRYVAELEFSSMRLDVLRHKQNLIANNYYHPYISDGDICWGNAASTSHQLLAQGAVYDVFALLASLLSTYSDGTPYQRLSEFEHEQRHGNKRYDASDPIPEITYCQFCDAPARECDCDRCNACDELIEECDCYICSECDARTTERCHEHWCSICETAKLQSCACCTQCRNTECSCCDVCNGGDIEECQCCFECHSSANDCEACPECGYHQAHAMGCKKTPNEKRTLF